MLDRIDKAIIGLLLKYKDSYLSTKQIADKVKISPRTAKKHLEKLESKGYVSSEKKGKTREYEIKHG
jgi:Mn-dependent DtxR family transcriptional regulator